MTPLIYLWLLGAGALLGLIIAGSAAYAISILQMSDRNEFGLKVYNGHGHFIGYHFRLLLTKGALLAGGALLLGCGALAFVSMSTGATPYGLLGSETKPTVIVGKATQQRAMVPTVAPSTKTEVSSVTSLDDRQAVAEGGESADTKLKLDQRSSRPSRPAQCDLLVGDDPEWQFDAETCAFTPWPEQGRGSFLLDFHSTASKSAFLRVAGNSAELFIRDGEDDAPYERVAQLARSATSACWESTDPEVKVCARAR